jgi:hypothetical protein
VGSPKITASLVNMLELELESLASLPARINGQVGICDHPARRSIDRSSINLNNQQPLNAPVIPSFSMAT